MSFAYLYLHHVLDKNSHVEALYANRYGKIKSRKKSLGKEKEKNRPKEERKCSILSSKEKKSCRKRQKALGLTLLAARVLPFALPLASLPIILCRAELKSTERDRTRKSVVCGQPVTVIYWEKQ